MDPVSTGTAVATALVRYAWDLLPRTAHGMMGHPSRPTTLAAGLCRVFRCELCRLGRHKPAIRVKMCEVCNP